MTIVDKSPLGHTGTPYRKPPPSNRREPGLKHNAIIYFLGYGLWSACNWLMVTVLAKLGSPQIVGQYALGLAVAGPIIIFAQFNLRSIQATDAHGQFRFGDYLAFRLLCMLIALLLVAAICAGARYRVVTVEVVLWIALGMAFDSFSDTCYGLLQLHERMNRIAVSLGIKGLLSLLAFGGSFRETHNIVIAVAASSCASAVIVVCYDFPSCVLFASSWLSRCAAGLDVSAPQTVLRPRWDGAVLWRLLKLSFPMGLTMLLIGLNGNMPRYFIDRTLGERSLGIFAALSYLVVAGRTVMIALGQATYPRLGQYFAAGRRDDFRALSVKLILLCLILGASCPLIALVIGRPLLQMMYRPEYARHMNLFVLILAGGGVTYAAFILGFPITAARYIKAQVPWFGLTTAVCTGACWWLVPRQGLMGAAWAVLLAAVVQFAYGLLILRRILAGFDKESPGLTETKEVLT